MRWTACCNRQRRLRQLSCSSSGSSTCYCCYHTYGRRARFGWVNRESILRWIQTWDTSSETMSTTRLLFSALYRQGVRLILSNIERALSGAVAPTGICGKLPSHVSSCTRHNLSSISYELCVCLRAEMSLPFLRL